MAYIDAAYVVMAYIDMAYVVIATIVMAYTVMSYIRMAYIGTALIVMSKTAMAYACRSPPRSIDALRVQPLKGCALYRHRRRLCIGIAHCAGVGTPTLSSAGAFRAFPRALTA